jgi:AcrR family transcriptional regulator
VSLREINRESGARNAVALQYHFKDRAGIVRAVVDKHYPAVERHRHELLDLYEQRGNNDIRELSAALVLPSAAKLSDPNGGPEFLQISAEFVNQSLREAGTSKTGPRVPASIDRWRALVEPFLGQDAAQLHRRFTAIRFSAAELGRRAESAPHRDDRLFTSQLVDLVTALLLAPVSSQTATLAATRQKHSVTG